MFPKYHHDKKIEWSFLPINPSIKLLLRAPDMQWMTDIVLDLPKEDRTTISDFVRKRKSISKIHHDIAKPFIMFVFSENARRLRLARTLVRES